MIHRPEHVMQWHVIVWTALFVIGFMMSTGLLLRPAQRRPPKQQTKQQPVPEPQTSSTGNPKSQIPDEPVAIPQTREERWQAIKAHLGQVSPEKLDTGVTLFTQFLKDFQPSLSTLQPAEYDDYYKYLKNAVSQISSKAGKDVEKMKNLFHLTKWTYKNFPYKEGWFSGNKNSIEDEHRGTCTNLQSLVPSEAEKKLYAFVAVDISERTKYIEPAAPVAYKWPNIPIPKTGFNTETDYAELRLYLTAVEQNLYKIRPMNDPTSFKTALDAVYNVIEIVKKAPATNRYRNKAVSRLLDTMQSSFPLSKQTSIKDALTDSRSKQPESSYEAAKSSLEEIKNNGPFEKSEIANIITAIQNVQKQRFLKK